MIDQEEMISNVCDELKELLIRKNRDYGNSFSKQYEKYGMTSSLIRMEDKMNRLSNLISGAKQEVNESIDDTLQDLAGYALLTLVVRKSVE